MTKNDQPINQTNFEEVARSIIHTGSGGQQVSIDIIGPNLSEAIALIKQLVPKEQADAIEKLKTALRLLGTHQKTVSTLKKTHHMLHGLETSLAAIVTLVENPDTSRNKLNFLHIREVWRITIRPVISEMSDFSINEMKLPENPLFNNTKQWFIQLELLRSHFEISLKEKNAIEVYELLQNTLDDCRDHLRRVDRQLLEAINVLEEISNEILRRFENG